MSTKLAIVVIHGTGSPDLDFAKNIIQALNDRISCWKKIPKQFWATRVHQALSAAVR